MAYRCDFVAFHAYWGTNEATNGQAWYNKLKSIYDSTKRPIWITEWNNGASWTTESWPDSYSAKLEKQRKAMKEILNVLDTCSFVERYAFYNWDTYYRCAINWDDGSLLPAGRVYRDSKSDFAYNSKVQFTPIWWKPGIKTPTMTARINEVDNELVVNIENKNGDLTDILTIQRLNGEGTWEDYYTETLRYKFDNETLKYSFPLSDFDIENTQLRLYIKRTVGDEVTGAPVTTGYVQNPNILVSSKNEVPGWTCVKDASAGYTKATGDTYMEVWNETAAGMHFDYYQDIEDLPAGIYELSAAVFNTADGTTNNVNGSVVLYAQADSVQYATPVTEDTDLFAGFKGAFIEDTTTWCLIGSGAGTLKGSNWNESAEVEEQFKLKRTADANANIFCIEDVVLYEGDQLQIRAMGTWTGQHGVGYVSGYTALEQADGDTGSTRTAVSASPRRDGTSTSQRAESTISSLRQTRAQTTTTQCGSSARVTLRRLRSRMTCMW